MRDSDYEFIRSLVYERSRINLGPDKRDLVSARLAKRLRATQIGSISDYCSFLRTPAAAVADEVANLIERTAKEAGDAAAATEESAAAIDEITRMIQTVNNVAVQAMEANKRFKVD